jgi:hypothetical protein
MKSQSLSMNNITYIYKHIKSGNGRNVFRVCLKILWGNACVSSFQMLLGYINSKNVRYLFEFARRKCGIPKIAIWRYFTDVLVDMSHICGLSSDCLLLMFFWLKLWIHRCLCFSIATFGVPQGPRSALRTASHLLDLRCKWAGEPVIFQGQGHDIMTRGKPRSPCANKHVAVSQQPYFNKNIWIYTYIYIWL